MADSLPIRLEYLQQTLDELGKVPDEDLNESNEDAASLMEQTLRDRVKGLTASEANEVLEQDCEALKQWLDESGTNSAPGYFIYGWFVMIDVEWLLAEPEPPEETTVQVTMDPPAGYRMETEYGSISLSRRGCYCSIMPIRDEWYVQIHRDQLKAVSANPGPGVEDGVSEVAFGAVTGDKRTYLLRAQGGASKRLDYVLKVPGGWVMVTIQNTGSKPFDEAPLEAQFPTLRIEGR